MLRIGRTAREIWFNQSEALPRSGWWRVNGMEFLRSILRRRLAGRPAAASPNVGCFLRLALYWIAYFAKMKQNPPPVQYEQQWHRTETLCSHSSKIVPELLVERAWCIKFQSLLLRSAYLLPCQWVWVPAPIHLFQLWSEYRFTLWWKVAENYPLVTIHFQDRRGAASFRNQSRQNHPFCVNGSCIRYAFVSAQEPFCIAWT